MALILRIQLEYDRSGNFDLNFQKTLDHYSKWIKSQCRIWRNSKYDFDDLYSESLIVVMRIVQHHSHLKIESKEFKNLLFRSVKNRLIDIHRRFSTQRRDRFLEVAYESNWDDGRLAEVFSSNAYSAKPDEVIEIIQLARKLENKLDEIDRKMLRQLIDPDSELIRRSLEHEKVVAEKANRRSSGSRTDIPVFILGSQIGLSYKQALRSLERIRSAMSKILAKQ